MIGQELENRLSSLGSGRCGPNQGLHRDELRDPRLSGSANGTPNVSPRAVLKHGRHELLSAGQDGPGREFRDYQPRVSKH